MPKSNSLVSIEKSEYEELIAENHRMKDILHTLAGLTHRKNSKSKKREQIRNVVKTQLRETIRVHGPIDDEHGDIGSATKRISGQLYGLLSGWAKGILVENGDVFDPDTHCKHKAFLNQPTVVMNKRAH